MNNDVSEILVTEEQIREICKLLGNKITKDNKNDSQLLVIGLLKGAMPFMAELIKWIDLPIEIDFMVISSYDGVNSSNGKVEIKKDISSSIKNKNVLIVDDIVDTGYTLKYIVELLNERLPKSIKVATLLDKPDGRIVPFEPDYIGAKIQNSFVVGFGLDYNEKYRNLPYIGILKRKIYESGDMNE